MNKFVMSTLPIVAVGALVTGAQAQNSIVASFTYNSLTGSYAPTNATTGVFTANAASTALLNSAGSFNRLLPSSQNASFAAGFVANADPADVALSVNVSVSGIGFALGTGTLTITDIDGDQFTTGLNGFWTQTVTGINFNAAMVNPMFIDNGAADNTFNGNTGSWSMNFGPSALSGAAVSIVLSTTGFFNSAYADRPVGLSGQIVPSPGAIALAGLAAAVAGRRRRS